MLDSQEYRELRNVERHYTSIECTMSDNGSIEENVTGNSSKNVEKEVSRFKRWPKKRLTNKLEGLSSPYPSS